MPYYDMRIKYAVQITPLEYDQADTDDRQRKQDLKRNYGSRQLLSSRFDGLVEGRANGIVYSQETTTTNYVDLLTVFSDVDTDLVIFCIVDPVTDGQTPDVTISLDGGVSEHMELKGQEDFAILRLSDVNLANIQFKSTANGLCQLDIIVRKADSGYFITSPGRYFMTSGVNYLRV
jgi:hypothetical protein